MEGNSPHLKDKSKTDKNNLKINSKPYTLIHLGTQKHRH